MPDGIMPISKRNSWHWFCRENAPPVFVWELLPNIRSTQAVGATIRRIQTYSPSCCYQVQRWVLFLAAYSYKLKWYAGSLNGNADRLSRLPLGAQKLDFSLSTNWICTINLVDAPVTVAAVRAEMRLGPISSWVYDYAMKDWSSCTWIERVELTCEDGAILWESRVVIPSKSRLKVFPPDTHRDGAHEDPCSKLCVVAKFRRGHWEDLQGLRDLHVRSKQF